MGDEKDAESRFMKGITKGFFSVMGDHLEIELSFAEKMLNIFLKCFIFTLLAIVKSIGINKQKNFYKCIKYLNQQIYKINIADILQFSHYYY